MKYKHFHAHYSKFRAELRKAKHKLKKQRQLAEYLQLKEEKALENIKKQEIQERIMLKNEKERDRERKVRSHKLKQNISSYFERMKNESQDTLLAGEPEIL